MRPPRSATRADGVGEEAGRRPRPSISDRRAGSAGRYPRRRWRRAARRSARAAPTSASEWPTRPRSCAISTPQSQTDSPGPNACTSKPWPVRVSMPAASIRSAEAKSCGVVIFILARSPSTARTARPASAATAASSVRSSRAGPAALRCASSNAANGKPCGVCAVRERLARHGGGDLAVLDPLHRLGDRKHGDRAVPLVAGGDHAGDDRAGDERARGVVHEHQPAAHRRKRLQAVPHRFLARRAADDGRQQLRQAAHRRLVACRVAVADHRQDAVDVICDAKRPMVRRNIGLPPTCTYCLGRSRAARLPRPAATTIAAVFQELTIVALGVSRDAPRS